jgi:high-affinity iron transporter
MLASFLITVREGLEAALIVGIVLSVLRRLAQTGKNRLIWFGVGAAVLVSAAVGWLLNRLGVAFEGRGEQIFEGFAMLLAAGVLTWMIFWMQRQGRGMQAELERDVRKAVATGGAWALFGLAFVAVVREGIETALFLTAAAFSATPAQTLIGGLLGLALAVALGWLIFAAGKQLNLRAFFWGTSVLLLFFAAGLFAHGVHEFQEAGLLPIWAPFSRRFWATMAIRHCSKCSPTWATWQLSAFSFGVDGTRPCVPVLHKPPNRPSYILPLQ